jgi:alkanesulfonate monooxygenase SsuD/methylene tetrahydromethanopterin reductase-like flavin-dependent oxidoreductase (luciferase family)
VRIGAVVIQGRPFVDLKRDWQLCEEVGFSSLWVFDHLMTYPIMGVLLEAWTTLAAMAVSTERIRIGVNVTNITYRNPAVLAKEAITIDHLSGGRLELGIGAAGTRTEDVLVTGADDWPLAERVERFGEFVEMVGTLTSGRSDRYDGRHYRSERFNRGPWPVQEKLPLTIAAHGPRTLRVVAQHADTWSASAGWNRPTPDLFGFIGEYNRRLDDLAREYGRDPASIARSLTIGTSGLDWWRSRDAFDDFVGRTTEAGSTELIFAFPPAAEIDAETFLDLVKPYL